MLNHIAIMGRMVADPIMRQTGNGINVCSFRIACDRNTSTDGGQKADFIDCVAWRKTGEFVKNWFVKGKPILITGRLQMREWTDREGKKRTSAEIIVEEAHFCGGDKTQKTAQTDVPPVNPGEFAELAGDDSGLPFLTEGMDDLPL